MSPEYNQLLSDLKRRVDASRHKAALSVNKEFILLYHHIGVAILNSQIYREEDTQVFSRLSSDLEGFSLQSLRYMCKFAEEYSREEVVQQAVDQMSWDHIVTLIYSILDETERRFYPLPDNLKAVLPTIEELEAELATHLDSDEHRGNAFEPAVIPATLADYPAIQNMWPFYVYEIGRECGFNKGWECPTNSTFVSDDLSPYFKDPEKIPFVIKVDGELAGFILVSKLKVMPEIDFYLSEFFVLAKFQNKNVGRRAAIDVFNRLKGKWALGVVPENKKALTFWRKTLASYTAGRFSEFFRTAPSLKTTEHPDPHPMIIFTFES